MRPALRTAPRWRESRIGLESGKSECRALLITVSGYSRTDASRHAVWILDGSPLSDRLPIAD
jgi:hypothetical protein